jgi:membrane-bound lytic murein transglycosylase MltF
VAPSLERAADPCHARAVRRASVIHVVVAALAPLLTLAASALGGAPAAPASPPPRGAAVEAVTRPFTGDLDGMIKRRAIRVLTTYSKTHYFLDRGAPRGITYDAMRKFEDELNAKLKTRNLRVHVIFVPVSRDELLPALVSGKGDVAMASLTITPEREKLVDFTAPTATDVSEIVVTGPRSPALTRVEDLAGKTVFVRKSSSYHESLLALNERLRAAGQREVTLKLAPETLEDEDLLEMVNAGLVKIVVVDDYLARFWKQVFPKIVLHDEIALRTGGRLGLAIRKGSPKLRASLDDFVRRNALRTTFGNQVFQRYLRSTKFVRSATGDADMKRFDRTVDIFRKYGDRYEMDALLLVAQGYQESTLDQSKKSHVGAIGVMQVMPATGKDLAVGDIRQLDPNIHAGVKYIRFMIDRYFADEPMDGLNKGLFAFAAYNAGPGRVRQLREEARRRGLDPNVWFNNVERIAAERIGRETVQYVSNIFKYYVAYQLVAEETAEREKAKEAIAGSP